MAAGTERTLPGRKSLLIGLENTLRWATNKPLIRTRPWVPDIPTQVISNSEAHEQALQDRSVFSARSRHKDYLEARARDPLLRTSSKKIDDYPDGANKLARETELMAKYGVDSEYDENKTRAEIARRYHWNNVIFNNPDLVKHGFTTDALINEENQIAQQRIAAEKARKEHTRALRLQEERNLNVVHFIDSSSVIGEIDNLSGGILAVKIDQLLSDRSTTVGQLNDTLFEALEREAARLKRIVDSKQERIDQLSQGVIPDQPK